MLADTLIPIDKAEEKWTAQVHLNLELERTDREILLQLKDLLRRYPGPCAVFLNLRSPNGSETVVELPDEFLLKPGAALKRDVKKTAEV